MEESMIRLLSWLGLVPRHISIAMLLEWIFRKREFYPGYGLALDLHVKKGSVLVVSRFTNGPAGRAGVHNFDQLLEIDGDPVIHSSKEEFIQWFESRMFPRYVGKKTRLRLRNSKIGEYEVSMVAELTTMPPVYYDRFPSVAEMESDDEWRVKRGLAVCQLTGQFVPTVRLSDEALRAIFT